MAEEKKRKKYRKFWFFVKVQMILLVLVVAAVAYFFFGGYAKEIWEMKEEAGMLVNESSLDTFKANQTSIVYAADKSVISTLKGAKESYYLELEDIPANAVAAIVSIEDKKFYRHDGIDYRAMLRAVKAMIQNGEATQGGSTITMQLARNIFLSQEKTWQRKVEEIFIAWNLEKKYTKDEIIEFYLNNIYFGSGYYGIQSASKGFFNRDVNDLSLSQLAFLCAIPNNPTLYDPLKHIDNTLSRRDRILKNMLADGKISELNYAEAVVEDILLERPETFTRNDYAETYTYYCAARALMENEDFHFRYQFDSKEAETAYDKAYEELYAACQKKLYTAGYRIYTSLDLSMQEKLQGAVDDTLKDFTEVNEEGVYELQASAVCIDNDTGYVKAIVGGRQQDFHGYTLNRAYQSFRQPGSAIKPLTVYTPSFERNYTPDTIVVDEPIEDGPKNANGSYAGAITLRAAVENSVNTVAWKLYGELTPKAGLSYLEEMNFSRLDQEDYRMATALGGFTNGVSALEMAAGYATLENDGIYRMPTCIIKIEDAAGNEIYASSQTEKVVYRKNAARMMTDVLKGVVLRGTARGLSLGEMPCAGKTGTTNDHKDGWFAGYTRYYTASVWVGYDMPKKMDGLTGAAYPGKIWRSFMQEVHEGLLPMDFLTYVKASENQQNQNAKDLETAPEEHAEGVEIPPEDAEDTAAEVPESGNIINGEEGESAGVTGEEGTAEEPDGIQQGEFTDDVIKQPEENSNEETTPIPEGAVLEGDKTQHLSG